MGRGARFLSITLVFLGFVMLLNSGIAFTGLIIADETSNYLNSITRVAAIIGIIFVVIGGLMLNFTRK